MDHTKANERGKQIVGLNGELLVGRCDELRFCEVLVILTEGQMNDRLDWLISLDVATSGAVLNTKDPRGRLVFVSVLDNNVADH